MRFAHCALRRDLQLAIIFLAFGLGRELGADRDVVRNIDRVLIRDVIEAGHEQRVRSLGDPDLCHAVVVGEGAVGMQKDVGAPDGGVLLDRKAHV